MQQADARRQCQVAHRQPLRIGLKPVGHRLVRVEQHAVAVGIVAVQLDVADPVGEGRRVQAQGVAEQVALEARLERQVLFRVRRGEVGVEHGRAALDRRAAEAACGADIDRQVRVHLIKGGQVPARLRVRQADIGTAAIDDAAIRAARRLDQAGPLAVLADPATGGDRQVGHHFVADLAEHAPRRVGVAQAHPVVGIVGVGIAGLERVIGRQQQEAALVEVRRVAAVEIDAADLPAEGTGAVGGKAHLLRPLVEITDPAEAQAIAVGDAVDREIRRRTAVRIAGAEAAGPLIGGDRGQRRRTHIPVRAQRGALRFIGLRIVAPLVQRDAVARFPRHVVRPTLQRGPVKHRRRAVIPACMAGHVEGEPVGRGEGELQAHVAFREAAHGVFARGEGAVQAGAGVGVVDPVVAVLYQRGGAEGEHVLDDRAADARV